MHITQAKDSRRRLYCPRPLHDHNLRDGKFVWIRNEHIDNRLLARNYLHENCVSCIEPFIRTTLLLSQVELQSKQQLTKPSIWFERYSIANHANSAIKEIRILKRDWRETWVDLCSGKYMAENWFGLGLLFLSFFLSDTQIIWLIFTCQYMYGICPSIHPFKWSFSVCVCMSFFPATALC